MRSRGSLRTAQTALQKAISKRDSVGEAYRGFMSEVKEELEVRLIGVLHVVELVYRLDAVRCHRLALVKARLLHHAT